MIKKKATRQFLENLRNQVAVLDTERFSPKYFNLSSFPDTFGSGKNLIKLSTRTNLFVPESLIRIEVLDGGGNVVYHEVLDYLGKDKSRAIAVYIYTDTVPGDGRIRIAGRLQINPDTGERYPLSNDPSSRDFIDQPNILWEGTMRIAPERKNDSEIVFTKQPRAIITEEIRTFQVPASTSNLLTASLAGTTSRITLTSRIKSEDRVTGNARSNAIIEDQFDAAAKNIKQGIPNITSNSGTSTSGNYIVLRDSPTVAKTTNFTFTDAMIGGTLLIANPSVVNSLPLNMQNRSSYLTLPTTYSASITRVLDSSTVELSTPFVYTLPYTTTAGESMSTLISKIDSSANFTASYTQKISVSGTENSQSFANITLSNIEPATGDIYRVKTLYKPAGAFGEFIDLGDTVLESYNVLVDTGSYGATIAEGIVDLPVGTIIDANHISTYWESTQALTYSNTNLISSIQCAAFGQYTKLNSKKSFNLIENTQYEINFDSYVNGAGIVDVYVSGSIVQPDLTDTKRLTSKPQANLQNLGTYIGTLEQANAGRSLDNVFKFSSTNAGNAKLVFALRSGTWQFSDIQVNTLSETGFTPNYTKIKVRVPTVHLKSELIFKFQYFNYQGVRAALETVVYGVKFNGENFYIDGTNNLLTGSVYIGNSIASGIEMAGVSSGYIKSVGYSGLTSASLGKGPGGFLIYSGSGNLVVGADTLTDVGMELVGDNDSSHLIFRTGGGGSLDVKAEKFFIGTANTQFISGANSNIEISSSLFHLDPKNNRLVIGADAVINATLTANEIRTPATIGGSPSTEANASSSISSQGFAKFVSASIGGFVINTSQIRSSNNALVLNSSGQITGSNVLFTGGRVASFTLSSDALTGGTSFFISSSVGASPSTNFFISSSRFNVRQDGTITGSNVLFSGGTIGGFTIGSSTISSSNLILDSNGTIRTATYIPDQTGWSISSAGNGFAEFENVKIRGTLSTAVFEKQSVNAVGGQLYVANSTVLTGSAEAGASTTGIYTATQTTMSVENVTGFVAGEIVTAKKFSGTGFSTEYIRINSASRANPSSETDFSGRIFVTRGLGSGVNGVSASLGETPGAGQSYSGSQVIVSTGVSGSGFIRINASPADSATPYIDIVERTGSGIYDVSLKARLGDLSGLAGTSYVFGNASPGFGLATNNVFLQGGIIANTGSIGGINMQSGKLFTGTGTWGNSNTGFYLDSQASMSLKDKFTWDGSNLAVSGTIRANAGDIAGFSITPSAISSSNGQLVLRSNGQITGSSVLAITGSQTMLNTEIGFIDAKNVGRQLISDNREYAIKDFGHDGGASSTIWDTGWRTIISSSAIILPFETNLFCYFHMYSQGEPIGTGDPGFPQYTTSSIRINIKSASLSTYDSFESTGIYSTQFTYGHTTTTVKQATPGIVSASISSYAGKLVQIYVQGRHIIRESNGGVSSDTGATKIKHVVLNTGRSIVQEAIRQSYPANGNANDNLPTE